MSNDTSGASEYKYFAFISYSHRDKKWGDWLHKAIETYKIPKRLQTEEQDGNVLPKRLFPVFRDREELPTSADLGEQITDALRHSRFLIVICSPNAARSIWVNEEIKAFKAMGRENRILSLIVDGEPNASDKPGDENTECFPEAMRFRVDAGGNLTEERSEPIAADIRPGMDGRQNALLKLVAGLLGVGFDTLRQREHERRVRRLMAAGAVMAVLLLAFAGLAWRAWVSEQKALKNEAHAKDRLATLYCKEGHDARKEHDWLKAIHWYERSLKENDNVSSRLGAADAVRNVILETTVMRGKTGSVNSMSLSLDGKTLASGSDHEIRIWDVSNGNQGIVLNKNGDTIYSVTISPDAHAIAWGSSDQRVHLWNITEQEEKVSSKEFGAVKSVVFSPDGQILAAGADDGTIRLWDMDSGKETMAYTVSRAPVERITFSHDGRTLAWVSAEDQIGTLDAATGINQKIIGTTGLLTTFLFPPLPLVFSENDAKLISGGMTMAIWNLAKNNIDGYKYYIESNINAVANFGRQSQLIGVADGTIRIVRKLKDVSILRGHTEGVNSIILTKDFQ